MASDRLTDARVGSRIRKIRHARGLDSSVLARDCGVQVGTVTSWERGERTMTVIQLLTCCERLEVNAGDVLNQLAGIAR